MDSEAKHPHEKI